MLKNALIRHNFWLKARVIWTIMEWQHEKDRNVTFRICDLVNCERYYGRFIFLPFDWYFRGYLYIFQMTWSLSGIKMYNWLYLFWFEYAWNWNKYGIRIGMFHFVLVFPSFNYIRRKAFYNLSECGSNHQSRGYTQITYAYTLDSRKICTLVQLKLTILDMILW